MRIRIVATQIAPELCFRSPLKDRGRRESRVLAAPAASRANKKAHERRSPQVRRNNPTFPAQWFTAYSELSPVTGLSCHRRPRIASQTWRQRRGVRTTRLRRPLSASLVARSQSVHRIPPNVRDDGQRPSL